MEQAVSKPEHAAGGRLPGDLAACPHCDLLNRVPALLPGSRARCRRCQAVLYGFPRGCIERSLALALSAAVLFLLANAFPFLSFGPAGQKVEMTLSTGVLELLRDARPGVAVVVALTSIVVPAIQIAGLVYVLLPLYLGLRPPGFAPVFRAVSALRPWNMMEVFLLGILVSAVKLIDISAIVPGTALWAFCLLIVALAWANSVLDPLLVWRRWEALA